jgi:hypothetical protein
LLPQSPGTDSSAGLLHQVKELQLANTELQQQLQQQARAALAARTTGGGVAAVAAAANSLAVMQQLQQLQQQQQQAEQEAEKQGEQMYALLLHSPVNLLVVARPQSGIPAPCISFAGSCCKQPPEGVIWHATVRTA